MTIHTFTRQVAKRYPWETFVVFSLFVLVSFLEMLGITSVLPLLGSLFGNRPTFSGSFGRFIDALGILDVDPFELLVIVVALIVGKSLVHGTATYVVGVIGVRIEKELKNGLLSNVLGAEWSFFIGRHIGSVTSIITKETELVKVAITILGQFLSMIVISTILFLGMAFVSPPVFVGTLVMGGVLLWTVRAIQKKSLEMARRRVDLNQQLSGSVIETLSLAKFIKGSALEKGRLDLAEGITSMIARIKTKEEKYIAFIGNYGEAFGIVFVGAVLFVGLRAKYEAPANMLLFLMLMFRAFFRFVGIQKTQRKLNSLIPSYEASIQLLEDAKKNKESRKGSKRATLLNMLEFRNVGFGYPGNSNIIEGVSLKIPARSMVGLVGPSGGGKTTLTDLITGLIRPNEGEVYIDGVAMRDCDIGSWRTQIGFVPQEPVLFNGSVRENIVIGDPEAKENHIVEAASMAHAHGFITRLRNGYDTIVGDRGVKLSGGEKQRIVLARAILRKPSLLILDEATSALDNESERWIQETLSELQGKMSIFVIAHRLSTIKKADMIYVIEDGRIAQSGRFDALLRERGPFRRIYDSE